MQLDKLDSPLLQYLAAHPTNGHGELPTVVEISEALGMSVGKLREQLAHARGLGLVSLRPRVGMRREPFNFARVILPAILFGLATGEVTFAQMVQLRRGVEESLWDEAVSRLTSADFAHLRTLIAAADARLSRPQAIIPHQEHRDFHLTIFRRLDNPLVQGILETYWDVYEANEIGRYYTYAYWREVWHYHTLIAAALEAGDPALARQRLVEHFNLLKTTPRPD